MKNISQDCKYRGRDSNQAFSDTSPIITATFTSSVMCVNLYVSDQQVPSHFKQERESFFHTYHRLRADLQNWNTLMYHIAIKISYLFLNVEVFYLLRVDSAAWISDFSPSVQSSQKLREVKASLSIHTISISEIAIKISVKLPFWV